MLAAAGGPSFGWTREALEGLEVDLGEVELEELCTFPVVSTIGDSRRGS